MAQVTSHSFDLVWSDFSAILHIGRACVRAFGMIRVAASVSADKKP
jgi:hypothetical protein